MKAKDNCVVSVSYELEVEGKIADKATEEKPLEYIHGTGMLLPEFEKNVVGKEPGETFDFILSPEDGYGVHNPEYIIGLPKSAFTVEGVVREDLLKTGNVIPMLNNAGQVVQGTVLSVEGETVKMDFNHPMAGKTLHFTGKVTAVREATEKELTEGLHGEYLPQEGCGGCHSEGCEGGCHEGGCHGDGEGCGHHEHKGEGCCHGKCHHEE